MQKIVLFIEPQDGKYMTPSKIGNLFMNRFAVDENGCHEILKIHYLEKTIEDYYFDRLTIEEDGSHEIFKIYYLDNTMWDYANGRLTKNKGPDRILQQNYYKTWKLNSGTKLSCKQKYEFRNKNMNLETSGGQTYM